MSRKCLLALPLFEGGTAVRFFRFVFFVWSCVFCRFFAVLLFLGTLFLGGCWSGFFWWVFAYVLLYFLVVSLLCPAALFVSPFLAVGPASWRFSRGAILGPARFWDSPGTYGTRARSPLSEALFLGREAAPRGP